MVINTRASMCHGDKHKDYYMYGGCCGVGSTASLSLCSLSREHPIGDKSFQNYIRQHSETSTHSI